MNRPTIAVSVLLIAAMLGVGWTIRSQRIRAEKLNELAQRRDNLSREVTQRRRELATTSNETATAERQLQDLPTLPEAFGATEAERVRVAGWLGRVNELRRAFQTDPRQAILELRLLRPDDWIRIAKSASLDTAEGRRSTLAQIRNQAKANFMPLVGAAIRQYRAASGDAAPLTPAALAGFLPSPATPEFLDRYSIGRFSAPGFAKQWYLDEKSSIDPDYDNRYRYNSAGGMVVMTGPLAWIPDSSERTSKAYQAYTAAHPGTMPSRVSDVVPFFTPPLDPQLVEKVKRYDAERKGPR